MRVHQPPTDDRAFRTVTNIENIDSTEPHREILKLNKKINRLTYSLGKAEQENRQLS